MQHIGVEVLYYLYYCIDGYAFFCFTLYPAHRRVRRGISQKSGNLVSRPPSCPTFHLILEARYVAELNAAYIHIDKYVYINIGRCVFIILLHTMYIIYQYHNPSLVNLCTNTTCPVNVCGVNKDSGERWMCDARSTYHRERDRKTERERERERI